jgi:predicted nuclease of predicted toxin-antitoxin system
VKLSALRVLTDENVHPEVVTFLRSRGLDVVTVAEAALIGADDVAILRRATADNRAVLTHDADFGRLAIAAGEALLGVIYVRPGHIRPEFTIESLQRLLAAGREVEPPFVVAVRRVGQRVVIRVRQLR